MKTIARKKKRRCDHRIMTNEGRILKTLRESKKLSMKKVGRLIGFSDSFVSHLENGRLDLNPTVILKLLNVYGYSYDEFIQFKNGGKELPESLRHECIEIIKRLSHEKLRTMKTILESF